MIKTTYENNIDEIHIEIELENGVFTLIDNIYGKHVVFDAQTAKFIINFIKSNIGDV